MHVQRDRVDGSVARVDDVHADFALENAVARVGVQVQPVTAGHDRAGRKRDQEAHDRGSRRESTTRGHDADGVCDDGAAVVVGDGWRCGRRTSKTWAERLTGRRAVSTGRCWMDDPLRGCVCGGCCWTGATRRVCGRSARRIRFEPGAVRNASAGDQFPDNWRWTTVEGMPEKGTTGAEGVGVKSSRGRERKNTDTGEVNECTR